jgi:hypothetical protein
MTLGGILAAMTMLVHPTEVGVASTHTCALTESIATDGSSGAPADTAQSAPLTAAIHLGRPLDQEAFRTFMAWWHQAHEQSAKRHQQIRNAIQERLGADGWELLYELDGTYGDIHTLESHRIIEELCAHMPGLDPVIRLVYAHLTGENETCGQRDCHAAGGTR